jgi:VanZ family protein
MVDGRSRPGGLLLMWGPVAIYVLLIFYVSSISNPPGIPPVKHFDKLIHFMEYGMLGFLLGRAMGLTRLRKRYWAVFVASLLIGACVGVADETYQGTVQGREKSLADFLVDVFGLLAASIVLRAWAKRWGKDA